MNDIIPQKLGKKYILLDLIGTGGMAEVYRAKLIGEKGFEKLIVIKKLLDQAAREQSLVEHFTAEARLAALLQHENIAEVYDFGCIGTTYFIAMEYLFGKDLYAIMQAVQSRGVSIPPQYALMIAIKICEAMAYAHSLTDLRQNPLNIIHRDLTPHNIFVSYNGGVKVLDFGIAKTEMHDNLTRVGVVKGKITYMSPEQLASEKIDHRADIFSIGILLYEMLSGRRMYTGDTSSLIRKAIKVEYVPLEDVVSGLDSALYEILHKTLAAGPDQRYSNCEEMREELEKCLGGYSLYCDPRLLSQFVTNLFENEYRHEEAVCRKALQAAERIESGNRDEGEKTEVFTPDFSSIERPGVKKPAAPEGRSPYGTVPETSLPHDGNSAFSGSGRWFPSVLKPSHVVVFLTVITVAVAVVLLLRDSDDASVTGVEVAAPVQTPPAVTHEVSSEKVDTVQQERLSGRRLAGELITKAERALADGRIELPPGENALYYYREAEKTNPGDQRINDGMKVISDRYAQQAENALNAEQYELSSQKIAKGLEVFPTSARLQAAKERLKNETQALIAELKEKVEASLEDNRLTSPVNDCAYKYLQEISKLDGENELVSDGYKRIADRYASLAENAFKRAEYDRAKYYVYEGLKMEPEHWRLNILKRDLSRGKPGLIFKTLEKNVKSLINL